MAKKKVSKKKVSKKKTSKKKAAPKEMLLVGSKVKAAIRDADCNTGGDTLDALNSYLHWLLAQGTARAQANGRKTVRGHDFLVS